MVTKKSLGLFAFSALMATSMTSFAGDSLFPLQWGLKNTGDAQRIAIDHYTSGYVVGTTGEDIDLPAPIENAKKVIVAVLDTGVDYTHPQLKNILAGKGTNIINPAQDATDTHGHGTHVSGIIAAQTGTERGMNTGLRGVSQNVLILPVKVVQTGPNAPIRPQDTEGGAGTALTENVAKGLEYAINNGAQVVNLSLAWPNAIRSKAVDEAMEHAKQKNVIIVSSAGNDSTLANVYPCIYENVICVGAHGSDGSFSHYSNFGSMVDILAPGTAILSTWPMNKAPTTFAGQVGYEFRNGTSMASPFVAGAIAELISRGYSPNEAKNRILLGSRSIRAKSQFSVQVVGDYSKNSNTEAKLSRFGNLDIAKAISIPASPLVLPLRKAPYDVLWDGYAKTITIPITWKNNWVTSGLTTIQVQDQTFTFSAIPENAVVTTPFTFVFSDHLQESMVHLTASVTTDGFQKQDIDIPVQIARVIRSDLYPSNAIVKTISNLGDYSTIRSVVNADTQKRADLVFEKTIAKADKTFNLDLTLVQDSTVVGKITLPGLSEDQLLNFYRLPDGNYAAIFQQNVNSARPDFLIKYFTPTLALTQELKIGTDVTVLSENFKWTKVGASYVPLWISIGYTPELDKAKFDPWDPKAKDLKMPRIFFLSGKDLRTLNLTKTQLPLQLMPNGQVLIADGLGYLVQYSLATIEDGKITKQDALSLTDYRMLVGMDVGAQLTTLKGSDSQTLVISGQSTPGNLRMTAIAGPGETAFDSVLNRASPLESLIQVVGEFADSFHQYYFVQTHYDLKFFTSGSNQTVSTTLNRYSYIPSMIFNRNFYPVVVRDQNGNGLPGIYIPATLGNGYVSEVVVVDPAAQSTSNSGDHIYRPANLRFLATDPACTEMGNLINATETEPAKQVFICGANIIQIPLTILK
jgi:hypothetical protein